MAKIKKSKNPHTKGLPRHHAEYTEFTGMTSGELIDEAEVDARIKTRKQKNKGYVIGFREYLVKKDSPP